MSILRTKSKSASHNKPLSLGREFRCAPFPPVKGMLEVKKWNLLIRGICWEFLGSINFLPKLRMKS
jgi:hypothetical protein